MCRAIGRWRQEEVALSGELAVKRAEERDMIMTHEAVLLDRWRKGDEDAFNKLIQENLPIAERLALKLTKDPNVAEDVVSESLIRAYRSAAKFHGGAQFKTWLHRIVVNCVLDVKRRHLLQTVSLDELHAEEDGSRVQMQLADGGLDALDRLMESEQLDAVQRSIERLGEDQKDLVFLFHQKGIGYQGIAEELHAPIGTVKSRLHRARQTIKEQIEREERHAKYRASLQPLKAG